MKKLTIAYLGPEKTNTHFAAMRRFGPKNKYVHAPTVDEVFHAVERGRADYGVVPVENSLEGTVTRTLDRFVDFIHTPTSIHGEIEEPIKHCLIVHSSAKLGNIKVVFSHPQVFAQCREWLEKHFHHACLYETNSTAEAVRHILSKRRVWVRMSGPGSGEKAEPHERAAIGRRELAMGRGKKLKAISIPEERDNKTRFLIIGLGKAHRGRRNKTSILFALKDRPGALHDALMPFKRNQINLTKIESRPSKRKAWEYLFFIDFVGHVEESRVKRALKALQRSTSVLRVLGSYPISKS